MTLESTIRKMNEGNIEEWYNQLIELIVEERELDEGRMKELHGYISQGKSAEWIAKKMKMDVKTIKALMDDVDLDEAIVEKLNIDKRREAGQGDWRVTNKDLGVWTGPARSEKDAKEKAMRKWGVSKGKASSPMFMKHTKAVKEEVDLDEARKDNYYTVGGDRYDGGVVFTVYVKGKKVHSQILDGAQDYEFKGKKYKDVNKAMDAIAKAHRLKSSDFKKVNEEVDLDEGTWKMPKNKRQIAPLLKLMRKPVKLGKDGDDAAKVVAPYIGDDELEDDLYAAGKKNPNGDARPAIRDALQRFGLPWEEELELDEMKSGNYALAVKGKFVAVGSKADMMKMKKQKGGEIYMSPGAKVGDKAEEVELDEKAKYDLYHKDFSSAMQHAYKMAKKLHGITIDPKEIDDKVATGPKKPSSGKTNKYRLKGDKGNIQIQVANLDNKKYELNMYKEEVDLEERRRSAAADARRDIKKDKDLGKRGKDSADVDNTATVQDRAKLDTRNVIMQLKKAADNPKHKVKFSDGKSVAIKPDVVKQALTIFSKLKSNDKEKVQAQMQKSHKDMMKALQGLMRKSEHIPKEVEKMNEDFRTGRFGVSVSLVDAVKDVIMGKRIDEKGEGDKEAYQKFFQKALKKFGVTSPSQLKGDKEKEFYDYVDKNWTADHEESKKIDEWKSLKGETNRRVQGGDKRLKEDEKNEQLAKMKGNTPADKGRKAATQDDIDRAEKKGDKKLVKKLKEDEKEDDDKETAKKAKKDEPKKNGKEKVEVDPKLDEVKEEMTEAQKAKREEIVKELKKKTEDFKEKYGDRWEDVMYATATKMAMKAA